MSAHDVFVSNHLKVVATSGDEWSVLCPAHSDHNASMRINVVKGVFICHGCGVRGGMGRLARLLGVRYSYDKTEQDMAALLAKLSGLKSGPKLEAPVFLPESYLDRFRFQTGYWTDPIEAGGRGLDEETVESFDLGFDPMEECVTIPIRNPSGYLLGVTRRYLDPKADLRYRDPKGFVKSRSLFASWFALSTDSPTLVLTEGPLDAIKVWQAGHPAVALFGSNLSEHQILMLRQMGTLKVVLFFDNDRAGRKVVRQVLGYETIDGVETYIPERDLRRFFIVQCVRYGSSLAKDPGAMSDQQINDMIGRAKYLR